MDVRQGQWCRRGPCRWPRMLPSQLETPCASTGTRALHDAQTLEPPHNRPHACSVRPVGLGVEVHADTNSHNELLETNALVVIQVCQIEDLTEA